MRHATKQCTVLLPVVLYVVCCTDRLYQYSTYQLLLQYSKCTTIIIIITANVAKEIARIDVNAVTRGHL